MLNKEKLEGFVLELGLSFEEQEENVWVVFGEERGMEAIIVLIEEPIVIVRVNVMDIPEKNVQEFYETLLRLNATDMIHGAYAVDGNKVILMNTLVADTMDLEEFQATLDAIGLALVQHYEILSKYRKP